MRQAWLLFSLLSFAIPAGAADLKAGEEKAAAVCAACHGANGVSVSPDVPNLAAQKAEYLAAQLKAFREGSRKNPLMNAIAPQLSQADVDNLVAYFSGLPGASGSATSPMPEAVNLTRVKFPTNYKSAFTHYLTINFPDKKEVRRYYANRSALDAAREGKPLPEGSILFAEVYKATLDAEKNPVTGGDGFFEPGELAFFTAMQTEKGWGDGFPAELRNGNWNYAVFKTDQSLRPGTNQAKCLACHKPLDRDSYAFTLEKLAAKAKAMK